MSNPKFDFSGYATKNGLKCSDGRIILKDAFKHQDGVTVPLVWQHCHNDPNNVLGHAVLENRPDGVYCYGKFNDTESGQTAKELVAHGDVSFLSIYANQLKEQAKKVLHGAIREVSLVLAGANPGAKIDNLEFAHGDGTYTVDIEEAVIYTGLELSHADDDENEEEDEMANGEKTVADVFNTLSEEQKTVVYAMIAKALEDADGDEVEHGDLDVDSITNAFEDLDDEGKSEVAAFIMHAIDQSETGLEGFLQHFIDEGDLSMKRNVFDNSVTETNENTLTHDQMSAILADGKRYGSLKESMLAHAAEYGLDPIDILFPDAKLTGGNEPQMVKRDDTWVAGVLSETTHTPFSRIKTVTADITADEARAKGYVTGNLKKEEIIPLMKRSTTPTTIYKKQKLDRDDVVDITDFNVVAWLKAEMRVMLNEELARAILIGDGRDLADEDKINEQNIRPIALDNDSVYTHRVGIAKGAKVDTIIDDIIRARKYYKGSGSPALYISIDLLTEMLLVKDGMGRRLYSNVNELASVLRVSKIVEIELMNEAVRKVDGKDRRILAIMVNLKDYTIGADKGGEINLFDDFDIDYNQQKYLIETRVSGALTRPKSALILEEVEAEG